MSLRRYASDVFGWSRYQPERGYEFNGTALPSVDGTVLVVDPVPSDDEEVAALRQLGQRFIIVLTTSDHERDAARLSKLLEAPVHVCCNDAASLRGVKAVEFRGGDVLPGGWVVHALTAMKTPGEVVLHHPLKRILVAGDAVINDPATGVRLVPHAKLPDRAGACASLSAVARLDFDALYVGDGFVLPSGGRDALRKFLAREGHPV